MECAFICSVCGGIRLVSIKTMLVLCITVTVSVLLYLIIDVTDNVVPGVGVSSSRILHTTHIGNEGNERHTVKPTDNTSAIRTYYSNILSSTWKLNASNVQRIRQEIQSFGDATKSFVLTKDNVHPGQHLKYSWYHGNGTITPEVYDLLPKEPPIGNRRYKTCSVVGNGGIIIGSGCGHRIDSNEFVFRCNFPPLNTYPNDTGNKSNLVTFASKIVRFSYNGLRTPENKTRFIQDCRRHKLIWMPLYELQGDTKRYINQSYLFREKKIPFAMGHPHHLIRTRNYWNATWGVTQKTSTGIHIVSVAIELCDEVQVYGFWPFPTSPDGGALPYHYHDKKKFDNTIHNFPQEFDLLVKLHQLGIIKMNLKCL